MRAATKPQPTGNRFDPAAARARCKQYRRRILDMSQNVSALHIGGAFSCTEIVDAIYNEFMRPGAGGGKSPDTFLMSKGHGCMIQYVILEDLGILSKADLDAYCTPHGRLGTHPDYGNPGIEASTGALGHGLSYGVGMALAARIRKRDSRVIVVMGDGEINEGSVWEAALCAGKHRLSNLTAVIDYNKLQSAGPTREIQDLEPLADKWRAFNFAVTEVDGHDVAALRAVFSRLPLAENRPGAIICHTVKGKGVAFAEGDASWHHKSKIGPDVIAQLTAALA